MGFSTTFLDPRYILHSHFTTTSRDHLFTAPTFIIRFGPGEDRLTRVLKRLQSQAEGAHASGTFQFFLSLPQRSKCTGIPWNEMSSCRHYSCTVTVSQQRNTTVERHTANALSCSRDPYKTSDRLSGASSLILIALPSHTSIPSYIVGCQGGILVGHGENIQELYG